MDSNTSPTKKALTDNARAALAATGVPQNDYGLDPDLRLRLQNRGARVRKSVTEGYATHRNMMATSSIPPDASTKHTTTIFRSAQDINRDVFASRARSPFISPKKRNRSKYEDQADYSDRMAEGDVDIEMHDASSGIQNPVITGEPSERRIKPLRKTKYPVTVANDIAEPIITSHVVALNHSMPEAESVDPENDPFL